MPISKTVAVPITYFLYYVDAAQLAYVAYLQTLIHQHQLPLSLHVLALPDKLNQKCRQQLSTESALPILLLEGDNKLSLLSDGLSVAPEWDKLQRRVVSAGRKSELLLQAAKISANSVVIDATAGFGHDSLILGSSGAQIIMLEQQPIMALLLLVEQQRMSVQPNWQKLMRRLQIIHTDAQCYFAQHLALPKPPHYDVVYLDPMFPADSYQDTKTGKGAKVGKHMQALHHLAPPPTLTQAQHLLQQAQAVVAQSPQKNARVVVKRPQQAPFFANKSPNESWHNTAVRFDGYF